MLLYSWLDIYIFIVGCVVIVTWLYYVIMLCLYCNNKVYFEVGYTENIVDGTVAHEECLQYSGDDNGAIADMSNNDNLDFEVDYMLWLRGIR